MRMPICLKPVGIHLKIPSQENNMHLVLPRTKIFDLNFNIVLVILVSHRLK